MAEKQPKSLEDDPCFQRVTKDFNLPFSPLDPYVLGFIEEAETGYRFFIGGYSPVRKIAKIFHLDVEGIQDSLMMKYLSHRSQSSGLVSINEIPSACFTFTPISVVAKLSEVMECEQASEVWLQRFVG